MGGQKPNGENNGCNLKSYYNILEVSVAFIPLLPPAHLTITNIQYINPGDLAE